MEGFPRCLYRKCKRYTGRKLNGGPGQIGPDGKKYLKFCCRSHANLGRGYAVTPGRIAAARHAQAVQQEIHFKAKVQMIVAEIKKFVNSDDELVDSKLLAKFIIHYGRQQRDLGRAAGRRLERQRIWLSNRVPVKLAS